MATFTVTTASDTVNPAGLSLREALASADANPGADTIYFAPILNETTIVLTQGELTIASDVTIDGGELQITIDATSQSRVLNISSGTVNAGRSAHHRRSRHGQRRRYQRRARHQPVPDRHRGSQRPLDGDGAGGGGIYAGGNLVLRGSTVTDNHIFGTQTRGGGILALHDVSLSQSTVSGNGVSLIAEGPGGGGGIWSGGNVTLDASTVDGNQAPSSNGHGGGIYGGGSVTLTNSTVAGNGAGRYGGGIYSRRRGRLTHRQHADRQPRTVGGGGVSAIEVTAANTIVVGNFRPNAQNYYASDISGRVTTSNGHNLFGSDVSGSGPATSRMSAAMMVFARTAPHGGVDAGVLAANGGPTETVALLDAPRTRRWDGAKASLPSPPTSAASRARRSIRTSAPSSSNNRTRQWSARRASSCCRAPATARPCSAWRSDEGCRAVAGTTFSTVVRDMTGYMAAKAATS